MDLWFRAGGVTNPPPSSSLISPISNEQELIKSWSREAQSSFLLLGRRTGPSARRDVHFVIYLLDFVVFFRFFRSHQ